jgi:hypothetical protein
MTRQRSSTVVGTLQTHDINSASMPLRERWGGEVINVAPATPSMGQTTPELNVEMMKSLH